MGAVSLKLLLTAIFFSFVTEITAVPQPVDTYSNDVLRKSSNLKIQKTTLTRKGTTIDWIPRTSQGKIAAAPPIPQEFLDVATLRTSSNVTAPVSELELPGTQLGPAGSVPVPRVDAELASLRARSKAPPPAPTTDKDNNKIPTKDSSKRQFAGTRWYVFSYLYTTALGCSSYFSMFKPYVQQYGDFSLIQNALTRTGQTLEAGWQYYPWAAGVDIRFFTFYTVDNYIQGDYKGGYNSDVLGWIQVDDLYFPGVTFQFKSTIDGPQYELFIHWELYEGNWWLFVQSRWIGYYPASLFSNGRPNVPAADTLAHHAELVYFYGEIYQTENEWTTTDMGSGMLAEAGHGRAAYIRAMKWADAAKQWVDYQPGVWRNDDAQRYNHAIQGSYVFLGGPGAGGVVGG